jgi:hypothetical protein
MFSIRRLTYVRAFISMRIPRAASGIFTWALLLALVNADSDYSGDGSGTIELSELVAYVQARGTGSSVKFSQSARFGSRGENFTLLVRRLTELP